MKTSKLTKTITIAGLLVAISISQAYAGEYPVAPDLQRKYRSETFMNSGKGELIPNTTYVMCNSDVECRRVGNSRYRVNKFKGTDFAKKSAYPLSPNDQFREKNMNYWANK